MPAPAPATPPADTSEGGGSGLRTVGFVALGVGGAALIGGVVTGLMAKGKESDATDQCSRQGMPDGRGGGLRFGVVARGRLHVLYIGGGVLAAAGVGMVVFGGGGGKEQAPPAAQAPRLELSPFVGLNGAGVFARGAF